MERLNSISVIIPTYNRKSQLRECLDSLARQAYPTSLYEVIVVDDGSTDGTGDFLANYAKEVKFNFSYHRQKNKGPAAARNLGIVRANGALVAFTDDDCTVEKNWLEGYVKSFDNDRVGGVGGFLKQKIPGVISEFIDYYKILYPAIINNEVLYLITANACYRKDVLLSVFGFEEKIRNPGGEDPDLSMKVIEKGYVLRFNPDNVVYHYHKDDIKSFYKTFCNYGRGARFLQGKWGDRLLKKAPRSPLREILGWENLKLIYGYYKYLGLKKSLPFWVLRTTQIYAFSKGFQKGY